MRGSEFPHRIVTQARPVSDPVPYGPGWVTLAWKAFDARRYFKGLKSLDLDPHLCRAANELAIRLGNGSAWGHDSLGQWRARLLRNGWNGTQVSEGLSFGGTDPASCVLIPDDDPDPTEPHRVDFESPVWTSVGISICPITAGPFLRYGGYATVVEYGVR